MHYAQKYSASHTNNQSLRFQHFARQRFQITGQPLLGVLAEDLISYRSTLDKEHEWYLGSLRGFLKSWFELGCSGIDEHIVDLLESWRLKGNVKGLAVQTLCPLEGPLSDFEFEALHQVIIDAFESSVINIEDFVLVQIFMATGRRPCQIADLKIKDLVLVKTDGSLQEFFLNVPRRKQRGSSWRQQFKLFAISQEIGLLVQNYIEQNKMRLSTELKPVVSYNIEEFPLFPKWCAVKKHLKLTDQKNLDMMIKGQSFHRTTFELRVWLDKLIVALDVPSERTGKLRIFPTRLRRTLATRAAREGFGELIIAELLDHTDTQNARIYTENVPEHVDAINEAVARQLAPLAQAFSGVVVNRESDAIRGNDLNSRVRCETGNLGTCGNFGFCGALAPIACYTCRNFQPWIDGPHQDVLNSLLSERDRILQITQDKVMAAITDRTILAVTQVIQICEKRNLELGVEHG